MILYWEIVETFKKYLSLWEYMGRYTPYFLIRCRVPKGEGITGTFTLRRRYPFSPGPNVLYHWSSPRFSLRLFSDISLHRSLTPLHRETVHNVIDVDYLGVPRFPHGISSWMTPVLSVHNPSLKSHLWILIHPIPHLTLWRPTSALPVGHELGSVPTVGVPVF